MIPIRLHIEKQIANNSGKNLFAEKKGLFTFINHSESLVNYIKSLKKDEVELVIDSITNKVLDEFYKLNQYYYFNSESIKKLWNIYFDLYLFVKNNDSLNIYEEIHYQKIRNWLKETNPFAIQLYDKSKVWLDIVVCKEYQSNLQLKLLKVEVENIKQPVLDIGCGRKGSLVKYLRRLGIESYGFDRVCIDNQFCKKSDWFNYNYGTRKWGTILSNISFSNHFNHHHNRVDGDYTLYAKTYMKILQSLKINGTFYYAPSLPFIEKYLSNEEFDIHSYEVANTKYRASIVKRNL